MSPVVDNDVVIAHVGGHDKGALTAFDVETGVVKWSNEMDGPAYSSPIIVTLAGVRQVVTFMQKDFVGVAAATGKLLWKLPQKSEYDENSVTTIAYQDTLIYSKEEKGLTAIRLNSMTSRHRCRLTRRRIRPRPRVSVRSIGYRTAQESWSLRRSLARHPKARPPPAS
jgi:outer membrane protein assembly factor BamB